MIKYGVQTQEIQEESFANKLRRYGKLSHFLLTTKQTIQKKKRGLKRLEAEWIPTGIIMVTLLVQLVFG
jgi:hypothetical protein